MHNYWPLKNNANSKLEKMQDLKSFPLFINQYQPAFCQKSFGKYREELHARFLRVFCLRGLEIVSVTEK